MRAAQFLAAGSGSARRPDHVLTMPHNYEGPRPEARTPQSTRKADGINLTDLRRVRHLVLGLVLNDLESFATLRDEGDSGADSGLPDVDDLMLAAVLGDLVEGGLLIPFLGVGDRLVLVGDLFSRDRIADYWFQISPSGLAEWSAESD